MRPSTKQTDGPNTNNTDISTTTIPPHFIKLPADCQALLTVDNNNKMTRWLLHNILLVRSLVVAVPLLSLLSSSSSLVPLRGVEASSSAAAAPAAAASTGTSTTARTTSSGPPLFGVTNQKATSSEQGRGDSQGRHNNLNITDSSSDEEEEVDDVTEEQEGQGDEVIYVRKNDGSRQLLDKNKILQRLKSLASQLTVDTDKSEVDDEDGGQVSSSSSSPLTQLDLQGLTESVLQGLYPDVTSDEIDILAAETAASRGTQHFLYNQLAAKILISYNRKHTPNTFSDAMRTIQDQTSYIDPSIIDLIDRRGKEIDDHITATEEVFTSRLSYFGFKTLERSYLLRNDESTLLERPQYLLMRVALGIHCTGTPMGDDEDERLNAAFETYDLMSKGYFTHASPTLFHSGTTHPQLSSCFLVQMSDDSISGIYDTLKRCAVISKSAGGIGLSVHNIRARGTPIRGTRGTSNGLVPMLRVYDVTSRYVDQGGGKRPGAFAVYIEPWHGDILDVLNLKKNHGKEEQRARDLFYGLWVPDLFMERVEKDGMWSLMCPHQCPGLSACHGQEFKELYERYEREGRFVRQMKAREVWSAILDSQIETGTPYLLYKDAANEKSNQKNLGTIQCSNLCTEIIQYTDEEEVAVCNLASICLPKFVVSDRGPYGSVNAESGRAYFDHDELHRVAKTVTRNLNKIIDINSYPVDGAKTSNHRHRPIGIGVSGLADAFLRLGLPFSSSEAKALNEAIFETIYHAAVEASTELAEKDGPYETFAGSPASEGKFQFDLWGAKSEDLPSRRNTADACNWQKYSSEAQVQGYDWDALRERVMNNGMRNSLLVAPMPTASTSQILGVNECFEPFSSNLYLRRVKAGEFIMANPHLLQDLMDRGLWTPDIRNQLMRDGGSVANIDAIPDRLKELYKTVWEIKMKSVIDMAADRGKFIDQSQSLNLFIADPTVDKLTAMHFYAWKKGLKTGMYYLRTKPAVNAIQYTVEKGSTPASLSAVRQSGISSEDFDDESEVCLSCQV